MPSRSWQSVRLQTLIVEVVPRHIFQQCKLACFQISEVSFWNLCAGQVVAACFAKYGFFQRSQVASPQTQLVYASRSMQQIKCGISVT